MFRSRTRRLLDRYWTIAGWGIGNPKNWASAYEAFAAVGELQWLFVPLIGIAIALFAVGFSCGSSSPDEKIDPSLSDPKVGERDPWTAGSNFTIDNDAPRASLARAFDRGSHASHDEAT